MRFIGYYEPRELPIKQGDTVTIRKGVAISTTNPLERKRKAGRSYKIKVHHFISGSSKQNTKVRWPGTGGFWYEVDINDVPEAVDAIPHLLEAERRIGIPVDKWVGNCFGIATAFVEAGLVKGTAVYGHWKGAIHPESIFAGKPVIQHGWIVCDDGRLVDPTRWTITMEKGVGRPFIHVGLADDREYDEGGNRHREAVLGGPPSYDECDEHFDVTDQILPSAAWTHAEALLAIDPLEQEPGVLTKEQLHWLANAPFDKLQPHAETIYEGLTKLGQAGFIPIDNRRRAQRLAGKLAS